MTEQTLSERWPNDYVLTACGNEVYWPKREPRELGGWASTASLVAAYGNKWGSERHYFDRDTLRYFGSTISGIKIAPHTAGAFTVELQAKAPAPDMRYQVTMWGADVQPTSGVCRHATRREATRCAADTFDIWSQAGLIYS